MNDKDFFNSLADNWDNMCNHPKHKVQYVIDKIQLTAKSKVLDIGSGTGITLPYIEEKIGEDGSLVALDFAKNMIEISKKKFQHAYPNITYVVEDFYNYDYEDKFDYVLAYSCYPHFKDKEKFFAKASSLLKDNGKLIIAHIESKDVINNRHKGVEDKIASQMLPSVDVTSKIMSNFGFKEVYSEDNNEYYICIGERY